ncbi:Alpha/Beta hydrolase protein [Epithele typhae]|uniref:Alpha/Beta hydrolase protein n=1 Tax=Epithele typhae TaxID=378194 RepID=UPI0020074E7D|nr:Alpha/Beta hydrolase protein [Epithele typhae]KAH9944359.1 Alpha/Beta hydrolase protein [Epithele typhae]
MVSFKLSALLSLALVLTAGAAPAGFGSGNGKASKTNAKVGAGPDASSGFGGANAAAAAKGTGKVLASATSLDAIPASTLTQFTNFGTNPNNVGMFVYKPAKVATNPALLVASHFCTGTAQIYFQGSKFAQLAEKFGYVVIFPSSPHEGTCWDVSSDATLAHDGGSDSLSIANAARFAVANWGVDAEKVFAVGTSSGAMMTSVLAGAYPDIFKAAVVDSGVAFGCFSLPGQPEDSWNNQCADGKLVLTGKQWAQRVMAAFPSFSGTRPRVQVWHGTADTILAPQNFQEEIKQWTTVFGLPSAPISNTTEAALPAGYSNATFGSEFQAILAQGVGHTVPLFEQQYLEFLGIA